MCLQPTLYCKCSDCNLEPKKLKRFILSKKLMGRIFAGQDMLCRMHQVFQQGTLALPLCKALIPRAAPSTVVPIFLCTIWWKCKAGSLSILNWSKQGHHLHGNSILCPLTSTLCHHTEDPGLTPKGQGRRKFPNMLRIPEQVPTYYGNHSKIPVYRG